ncbi:MAG TPA: enoyl-CoA hydratase-related protein [Vicinamibacterales bacterium]
MPPILIEQTGPVVRVTLNRPDVRNAFNEHMVAELTGWAENITQGAPGQRPRVAVIAGAGKTFCAGADLGWMSKMIDYSFDENMRDAAAMAEMFDALDSLPIPLIGRVHGAALGGGSGLAAVCDIVVASESATFGFTEAKLGILPAVISPYVVQKIGVSAARELFLTAARFPAARARDIGLVHAVVPEAELDERIDAYISELLTSAPGAITGAKHLIAAVAHGIPADLIDVTSETIARHRVAHEGQEGMRAFLEKRKPGWIE